jgi:hypothetical protein
MPTSWKSELIADNSGAWTSNALRFATEAEARGYVEDLYNRWSAVREFRVVESDDPVTSSWSTDRPTGTPLPRSRLELEVTAITAIADVTQFVRELTGNDLNDDQQKEKPA